MARAGKRRCKVKRMGFQGGIAQGRGKRKSKGRRVGRGRSRGDRSEKTGEGNEEGVPNFAPFPTRVNMKLKPISNIDRSISRDGYDEMFASRVISRYDPI